MLRLAVIIWIMLGTTLAGTLTLIIVSVPGLSDQGMRLIPAAAAAGAAVAIPAALVIARRIQSATARRA